MEGYWISNRIKDFVFGSTGGSSNFSQRDQIRRGEKMGNKFFKVQLKDDKTSRCPFCDRVNNHVTGDVCEHVFKLTAKGVVFFFRNFKPLRDPVTLW